MTVFVNHVCRFAAVLALFLCIHDVHTKSRVVTKSLFEKLTRNGTDLSDILDKITELNGNTHCTLSNKPFTVQIPLRTQRFDLVRQKADLVTRFIKDFGAQNATRFIPTLLKSIVLSDPQVYGSEMVLTSPTYYYASTFRPLTSIAGAPQINVTESSSPADQSDRKVNRPHEEGAFMDNSYNSSLLGNWTYPYFSCKYKRWIVTYTVPMEASEAPSTSKHAEKFMGTFDIDIDVSYLDINQCDVEFSSNLTEGEDSLEPIADISLLQIVSFRGTHKCDRNTSKCIFTPGGGWTRGSYLCKCKDGYFSTTKNPLFNGSAVENAWKEKTLINSVTYSLLFVCQQCAEGCDNCTDNSPCLSDYNWPFRISLLTISIICVLLTILLMCYVYNYRKLKVIKVASPIFLCVTLLGAVIMYLEMAAIFPVLDMYSCIATKWTRHLGFCITYSALLLKTWRVSLTYRVKSAHKIKLTDKQLLQWLFPILLVMVIYLSTWTVSSPPQSIYIKDYNGLKLKQCSYDWWDHSLAIGEILFLLWGIRVCYTVRKAESFFNEAKHISYAIYSITLVNCIMVAIHLMLFPTAPPDLKYLFGFIRTQFSTTVTTLLIFGPKFYRVIRGQGDVYDNRARARGVTASFSLNGIGLVHEEPTDLFQENEELKEEIQKLAAQIEFIKIVNMEMNNRHIKPKVGGYFSPSSVNSTQSPVGKAIYMKFDSSDSPTSRISPAAELVSERV